MTNLDVVLKVLEGAQEYNTTTDDAPSENHRDFAAEVLSYALEIGNDLPGWMEVKGMPPTAINCRKVGLAMVALGSLLVAPKDDGQRQLLHRTVDSAIALLEPLMERQVGA